MKNAQSANKETWNFIPWANEDRVTSAILITVYISLCNYIDWLKVNLYSVLTEPLRRSSRERKIQMKDYLRIWLTLCEFKSLLASRPSRFSPLGLKIVKIIQISSLIVLQGYKRGWQLLEFSFVWFHKLLVCIHSMPLIQILFMSRE